MEPESLLPYSKAPAIGPYPDPDESNPLLPTLLLDPFQYYPPLCAYVFQDRYWLNNSVSNDDSIT